MSKTYPHTTIIADLQNIASNSTRWGALAAKILNMYLAKKDYYTSRIAELENSATDSSDGDDGSVDFGSLPPYPHTSIQSNLEKLRASLSNSSSPLRQERLDLLDAIERDYMTKREWFTALRDAVEAVAV